MCDFADLALTVTVDQQISLRIQQDRATHLLRPVVKVSDAPQGGFDAADDDWNILECLARALRVDDHGTIRPLSTLTAGCVCVIASNPAIRGVAIDHGIHVAGCDAEEQVRSSEGRERLGAVPVRLSDDANSKALCFENTADDCHAEAGVIDVGVARDDDDVAAVPAQDVHLRPRHGQKRGCAEAFGPVPAVPSYVTCGLHEEARIRPETVKGRALFGRSVDERQGTRGGAMQRGSRPAKLGRSRRPVRAAAAGYDAQGLAGSRSRRMQPPAPTAHTP